MANTRVREIGRQSIGAATLAAVQGEAARLNGLKTAVLGSEDPEAVHDLRVCMRRIRSAIRVFGAVLPVAVTVLDGELHELFGKLGAIRDYDIALAQCLDLAGEGELGAIAAALRAAHAQAKLEATVALAKSTVFERLVAAACEGQFADASALEPVSDAFPRIAARTYRLTRRTASSLGRNSKPEAIHRLRRRAKRLRYTVEFFTAAYGKPARAFIASMTRTQDLLGAHQDAILVEQILQRLAQENPSMAGDATKLARRVHRRMLRLRRTIIAGAPAFGRTAWPPLRHRMKTIGA